MVMVGGECDCKFGIVGIVGSDEFWYVYCV